MSIDEKLFTKIWLQSAGEIRMAIRKPDLVSSGETLVHDVTKLPPGERLLSLGGGLKSPVDIQYFLLRKLEQLH